MTRASAYPETLENLGTEIVIGTVARGIEPASSSVLFAHGFRPFFLLAGLYGALAVPLWLCMYAGRVDPAGVRPPSGA